MNEFINAFFSILNTCFYADSMIVKNSKWKSSKRYSMKDENVRRHRFN